MGQAPTRILIFFFKFVFFRVFCVVFMLQNVSKKKYLKIDNGVGGWCLTIFPGFLELF